MLDITQRAALIEFSTYLIAAAAAFSLSSWCFDSRRLADRKPLKALKPSWSEKLLLPTAVMVLLVVFGWVILFSSASFSLSRVFRRRLTA